MTRALGVPQDYRQAADWYRKAAEQGLAEAQYGLGFLYHNGNGVPKDETQATVSAPVMPMARGWTGTLNEGYFWIFLANTRTMDSGLKKQAKDTLESLATVMKKSDIKSAPKRAQSWLNEHPHHLFTEQALQADQ
jgi:hypothetical protein